MAKAATANGGESTSSASSSWSAVLQLFLLLTMLLCAPAPSGGRGGSREAYISAEVLGRSFLAAGCANNALMASHDGNTNLRAAQTSLLNTLASAAKKTYGMSGVSVRGPSFTWVCTLLASALDANFTMDGMLADAALVTAGTPFRPAGFIPAAGKPSSLVSSINRIGDKLGVLYPPANPTATATSEMTEPAATTTNTTSDLPLEGPEAANTTTTTPQAEAAGVVSTATNITAATVLPAEVEANATTPAQPAADPATEEVPALTEQALPTPAAAKDIVDEQAAKPLRVVVPGSTTTSRVGRKLTAVTQGPVVPPTGGRTPNVHQRQTRLRREAPRARTNNARPGKN